MEPVANGSRTTFACSFGSELHTSCISFKRQSLFWSSDRRLRATISRAGCTRRCTARQTVCELNAESYSGQASTGTGGSFAHVPGTEAAGVSDSGPQPNLAARKLTRSRTWPRKKAELFVLRSDGLSCTRETVHAYGCLSWRHTSTQQELLVWRTRPACVLVVKKLDSSLDQHMDAVVRYLGEEHKLTVVVEDHEYQRLKQQYGPSMPYLENFDVDEQQRLHQIVDFTVTLGGDGVILHACTLFKESVPPIMGFNLGSMGFLTNHDFENYREDLAAVIYGSEHLDTCEPERKGVHITLRMRLLCEIYRNNEVIPGQRYEVLNEVVVDRGSNPFLTRIECRERGNLVTNIQADGVLLATPTGSTAYSVAAGGSMVHPTLPAILFTPICPHSLAFRPVILPDYADIELYIPPDARCTAWVCFDGKQRQELLHGDSVRVRMSPNPVPTINRLDQTTDWFTSLQRCFGWSDRIAQKPLPAVPAASHANGAPSSPPSTTNGNVIYTNGNTSNGGHGNVIYTNGNTSNGGGVNGINPAPSPAPYSNGNGNTNGHASNGRVNGHANGLSNGHASNGHVNQMESADADGTPVSVHQHNGVTVNGNTVN